jgi:rod shape-determining protein MreB
MIRAVVGKRNHQTATLVLSFRKECGRFLALLQPTADPGHFPVMFDRFKSFFSSDIGIDLGTANSLVYVRGEGVVLNEPSVVAIDTETGKVLAVGSDAKKMLGRTPGNIRAIRPMKDGVIADFEITEHMIRHFIRKVNKRTNLLKPRVLIAVPYGITEVEERAVKDSAVRAGARDVQLIEEPMAAAIGVGIEVQEPEGNMIVDIGGGTTEVAVISLRGIVDALSVRIGGDSIDDAIMKYVMREHSLAIGERTAERVKIDIGSCCEFEDGERTLEIRGRRLTNGLPSSVVISSEELTPVIRHVAQGMVEAVRGTLEKCPPELAADLVERGVTLAGGGALLSGFDQLIYEQTNLNVTIPEEPLNAVAMGTGKALEGLDKFGGR